MIGQINFLFGWGRPVLAAFATIALLGSFFWIVSGMRKMRRTDGNKVLLFGLLVGVITFLSNQNDLAVNYYSVLRPIRLVIVFLLLVYASVKDIKYHEVPPVVAPFLIYSSFIGCYLEETFVSSAVGFCVILCIMLIVTLIAKDKGFGGADIKILSAAGFILGLKDGLINLALGMFLNVILILILRLLKKVENNQPFPMIPCISISTVVMLIIQTVK